MTVHSPVDPSPATPPAKTGAGKGVGIAALVIAIVALALCWVPIVNNIAAVLGVVALILGVISFILASKRHGGKGLGIASGIIAVVAVVLVFVTQAAYVAAIDDVVAAIEDSADGESAASDKELEQANDDSQVLGLGQGRDLGEYSVTVAAVNLDAADQVAAANPYNDSASGQYVLVDLDVTYTGSDEGDPWIDLNVELMGADARIYSTSSADAVVENESFDVPTLTNGGSGSYQVLFDVPAEAVDNPRIRVTETFTFGDDSGIWATK